MTFSHALIMAAGRGTRMMPLTDAIPKPMAPYRGTTLIADGIGKLVHHIPNIHITIGYKKAMMASHIIEQGVSSVFNTEGGSNSWWIYHTLMSVVDAPVLVLTCDNVVEMDFEHLWREYVSLGSPDCMLVPVKPVPGLEGDYIHHRQQHVHKLNRIDAAETYCSGIQVLNPRRVAEKIAEGRDFYDVWSGLIASQQLMVSRTFPDKWFAVDTIAQLTEANAVEGGRKTGIPEGRES